MGAAWMVRAGQRGELEAKALSRGRAFVGWPETGDLSPYASRDEMRDYLASVYPEASIGVLANWTGQLWRFVHSIKLGDLVVMPLKTQAGRLAVGRVAGGYAFDPDADEEYRHTRAIDWLLPGLPRSSLEKDLLDSLGSLLTVCELSRHEAADRLEAVVKGEPDPGWTPAGATEDSFESPAALYAAALAREDTPLKLTIRQLLRAHNFTRRTGNAVADIEEALASSGLVAQPSIADGWLDSIVTLQLLQPTPSEEPSAPSAVTLAPVTLRVASLEAANASVVAVGPTDTVERACTLMLMHDFSQLPVIDENGQLHGAVSWESLGRARISNPDPSMMDACYKAATVDDQEDLLKTIPIIYEHDFVLVTTAGVSGVRGIITAADLTLQFGAMARPFALIEEIERRLRRRVDETVPRTHLDKYSGRAKKAMDAAQLTLGQYPPLLEDIEIFRRLGWKLDHGLFLERLRYIKTLRNELMHFSTDPLSDEDTRTIVTFADMLRTVDPRP